MDARGAVAAWACGLLVLGGCGAQGPRHGRSHQPGQGVEAGLRGVRAGAAVRTVRPGVLTAAVCARVGRGATIDGPRLAAFDADLLDALGHKLALRARVLPGGCAGAAAALAAGRVDLVAGAPTTRPEPGVRRSIYLLAQQALLARAAPGAPPRLEGLGAGTTVCAVTRTVGASWAAAQLPRRGARVMAWPSVAAAVAALAAGRCSAVITGQAAARAARRATRGLVVAQPLDVGETAALQVAAGNADLQARLDLALEELVYEGTYERLFRARLAPVPVPLAFQPPD